MKIRFNDLSFVNRAVVSELLGTDIECGTIFEHIHGGKSLILGEAVERFEADLADYCGVRHAVGVGSGTDALALALQAAGVGAGDEVLTVANTCPPTVAAIRSLGARPVFVDVDSGSGLMCPSALRRAAFTTKARAAVPVHLYGRKVDYDVLRVAADAGIEVVEDAAQGIGLPGLSRLSHAAALSFYPTKNLGAWGDGGAVLTNDEELAAYVRSARNYGMVNRDKQAFHGRNSRLDPLQALVLSAKLKRLLSTQELRDKLAARYRAAFAARGLQSLFFTAAHDTHHLFVVRHPHRDLLASFLAEKDIETFVHYRVPLHQQPANSDVRLLDLLPNTEKHCRTVLSLPLYPGMPEEHVDIVAEAVAEYCK